MSFYDRGRQPIPDHDPTKEIQFAIDAAVKQLGDGLFRMADAAMEVVKELLKEVVDKIVGFITNPEEMLEDIGEWVLSIPKLIGGLLSATIIPGLDASKIVSGFFNIGQINGLQANLDALDAAIGAIPGAQELIDKICNALGVPGTGHNASDVFNALSNIPGGNIVGAIAASLISGLLNAANIPGLDASKIVSGTLAQANVAGLSGIASNLDSTMKNIYNSWFGGNAATGTPAEVQTTIAAIKQAVVAGYTIDTFTTNGTWNKPANLSEFYGIAIGGGGKAANGATATGTKLALGGEGARGGGYIAQQKNPADVPSSLSITIGAAASTPGADGGTTSIGSLVSSIPNGSGISSLTGYMATSSTPGSGGKGGNAQSATSGTTAGDSGTGSAVGAAGTAGTVANGGTGSGNFTGGNGGNGGNASLTADTKCGGGGGGGGGGASGAGLGTSKGGNGGNGGYPGGASGGGGAAARGGSFGAVTAGTSGTPANGVAFIIWK